MYVCENLHPLWETCTYTSVQIGIADTIGMEPEGGIEHGRWGSARSQLDTISSPMDYTYSENTHKAEIN